MERGAAFEALLLTTAGIADVAVLVLAAILLAGSIESLADWTQQRIGSSLQSKTFSDKHGIGD